MIRLPNIPSLEPASVNNPAVRLDAATLPALAFGNLARTLSGVSGEFFDSAIQIQKVENGRMVSEARQKIAADYAKHLQALEKDPDPASRIQKTRDFLDAGRIAIAGQPDTPPAVQAELLSYYDNFSGKAIIDQTEAAGRLSIKRATLAMQNELTAAKAHGNRDAYAGTLDTATEAGLLLPEEQQRYFDDFDRSSSFTTLDAGIQADPAMVLVDIEQPDFLARFPGLTQEDIPRIRAAARSSAQRMRVEEMDLLEAGLINGNLTPEDIERVEYLTPGDKAKFSQSLDKVRNNKPPGHEDHAAAWDVLWKLRTERDNPAVSPEKYREIWNDARGTVMQHIPPQWQGDIKKELSYLSPAGRSPDGGGTADDFQGYTRADLEAVGRNIAFRARDAGLFGSTAPDATPAENEKAHRRAEDIRLEVKRWLATQEDATPETVREFTDRLISGDRIKSTARDLQSFIPGTGQRFRAAPAPAMPALPPKQGAKDKANADPLAIPPGDADASDALLPARQQLESFLSQP